jgi:hypothetical protein
VTKNGKVNTAMRVLLEAKQPNDQCFIVEPVAISPYLQRMRFI